MGSRIKRNLPIKDFEGKVLMKCYHGSRLFGTNHQESDTDIKGVVVPSGKEPLTCFSDQSDNQDLVLFTLSSFFRLLEEGQTVAFELLFCPKEFIIESSVEWDIITENRDFLIHKNIMKFVDFAKKQAYKYSNKSNRIDSLEHLLYWAKNKAPDSYLEDHYQEMKQLVDSKAFLDKKGNPLIQFNQITEESGRIAHFLLVNGKNYSFRLLIKELVKQLQKNISKYGERSLLAQEQGADFKAIAHALRIAEQALELLDSRTITQPRPNREYLMKIIRGEVSDSILFEDIEKKAFSIEEKIKKSTLPDSISSIITKILMELSKK